MGQVSTVGGAGPQAFLVEMATPNARLRPHFHSVEQFQIFVGGTGSLGRDPIEPVLAFYTDPYTSYGPITAGQDGLSFFTFRRENDAGAHYMPESRRELAPSPKRRIAMPLADQGADGPDPARAAGIGIELVRSPARTTVGRLGERPAAERFALVLDGSVIVGDIEAPKWSVLYWEALDNPIEVRSGDTGATVGVFTFDETRPEWFNIPVAERDIPVGQKA
jgi:hypothetical protein